MKKKAQPLSWNPRSDGSAASSIAGAATKGYCRIIVRAKIRMADAIDQRQKSWEVVTPGDDPIVQISDN